MEFIAMKGFDLLAWQVSPVVVCKEFCPIKSLPTAEQVHYVIGAYHSLTLYHTGRQD